MPFAQWLHGPLREPLEEALSERSVRNRGLLEPREVARLRQSFSEGAVSWAQPWLLMVLELWCRRFLDRRPEADVRSTTPSATGRASWT
jgi:hypothetical protein